MSVLYFSDKFLSDANNFGVAASCLNGTLPQYTGAPAVSAMVSGIPSLTFYQGTIPTASVQNGFLNSTRSSDALLRFTAASPFTQTGTGSTITLNFGTASFGTILLAGTITWFNIGNTDTSTSRPLLFGTVGLTGSGADLILPKNTVVANDLWLCTNMYFNVNNTATYA